LKWFQCPLLLLVSLLLSHSTCVVIIFIIIIIIIIIIIMLTLIVGKYVFVRSYKSGGVGIFSSFLRKQV